MNGNRRLPVDTVARPICSCRAFHPVLHPTRAKSSGRVHPPRDKPEAGSRKSPSEAKHQGLEVVNQRPWLYVSGLRDERADPTDGYADAALAQDVLMKADRCRDLTRLRRSVVRADFVAGI